MIAAILETPRVERLYSGLSVLVSAAAEGQAARGLATFGALELLLSRDLSDRIVDSGLVPPTRVAQLDRSARDLLATAADLPDLRLWACAAAVETLELAGTDWTGSPFEGVMSTPRFLRETAGAQLIFV